MNRIVVAVDRLGKTTGLFRGFFICQKSNMYDTELAEKVESTTWNRIGEKADRLGNMCLFRRLFLCREKTIK